MRQLILTNDNGRFDELLSAGLYFAWCNEGFPRYKTYARDANLIIKCEHETPEFTYYCFFDIRDCMNTNYRKFGDGLNNVLDSIINDLEGVSRRMMVLHNLIEGSLTDDECYKDIPELDLLESIKDKLDHKVERLEEMRGFVEEMQNRTTN